MIDLIAPTGIDYPEPATPDEVKAIVHTDFNAYERTFLRSDVEAAHRRVTRKHAPATVVVAGVCLDESELGALMRAFEAAAVTA